MLGIRSLLVTAAFAVAPMAANASVVGTLAGSVSGPFLTLSTAGLEGGSVATLVGGGVQSADQPFADIPKDPNGVTTFLSVGPSTTTSASLTFNQTGGPVGFVSFLWGSPDTYNFLDVLSTGGVVTTFTAMSLNFAVTNGNQAFSQYVNFNTTEVGESILSLTFRSDQDAFETANYRVTAVPGPIAGAGLLPLLGFGGVWFARRRKRNGEAV